MKDKKIPEEVIAAITAAVKAAMGTGNLAIKIKEAHLWKVAGRLK